jgi:hypothetical protein
MVSTGQWKKAPLALTFPPCFGVFSAAILSFILHPMKLRILTVTVVPHLVSS